MLDSVKKRRLRYRIKSTSTASYTVVEVFCEPHAPDCDGCLRAPSMQTVTWRDELRWLVGERERRRARWRSNYVTHGTTWPQTHTTEMTARPEIVGNEGNGGRGAGVGLGAVPSTTAERTCVLSICDVRLVPARWRHVTAATIELKWPCRHHRGRAIRRKGRRGRLGRKWPFLNTFIANVGIYPISRALKAVWLTQLTWIQVFFQIICTTRNFLRVKSHQSID